MIEKKCENCRKINLNKNKFLEEVCEMCKINDFSLFKPSEEVIKKDEIEKIINIIKKHFEIGEYQTLFGGKRFYSINDLIKKIKSEDR